MRFLSHLVLPSAVLRLRFPRDVLDEIEHAIAESETRHRAEIRFAIEVALDVATLRRVATPRDRALEVFAELRVWDTVDSNGVLVYVLIAERDVEIVADRGFSGRVSDEEWQAVCRVIEHAFREKRWRDGALDGIRTLSTLLEREFPALEGQADRNEHPDRPVVL